MIFESFRGLPAVTWDDSLYLNHDDGEVVETPRVHHRKTTWKTSCHKVILITLW
jgi:hypothetical protein